MSLKPLEKKGRSYDRCVEARGWDEARRHGDPPRGIFQGQGGARQVRSNLSQKPGVLRFSIIAKIIPGREPTFYEYAKNIEKAVASQPDILAVLKLHYLRWNLFRIKGETYFQYMGIFDTDFDKYTEDAIGLFAASGLTTVFEHLEGFPKDWKTNAPAFIKFVREHQHPSFLEYGEYPFVSADEIKKALKLKEAFSGMLDQMQ